MSGTHVHEDHRAEPALVAGALSGAAAPTVSQPAHAVRIARRIAEHLFGPVAGREFGIRYWDSGISEVPAGMPPFTIVLNHPAAFRRMFLPPSQLRLGEAYVRGDFDIEGDLESARGLARVLRDRLTEPGTVARVTALLLRSPRADSRSDVAGGHTVRGFGRVHTPRRDAAAIRAHYDVGNDFYSLWLDPRMVYSCGYFTSADADIETAQRAKLDHICRKLRLRRNDRLLDIGCGWGGLILHAAEHYGARAVGITLSQAQAEWATARAAALGLTDRCQVEIRDYREAERLGPFDKVASVGMCEHVGARQLPTYFEHAFACLRAGGLFLNHCIIQGQERAGAGARWRSRLWREGAFLHRYVFPDGELPRLAGLTRAAIGAGFEVRDVESLREHYVLTLRQWLQRLERAAPEAVACVGTGIYRIWRLYMAGSAYGFAAGAMGLAQMLLAKPDEHGHTPLPLTRADLYSPVA